MVMGLHFYGGVGTVTGSKYLFGLVPPETAFITQDEPQAFDVLRLRIEKELGWSCIVPKYKESVKLD